MSIFKSPQDANNAFDAAELQAWNKFAEVNNIKVEIDKAAYEIARAVFRAGYASGAEYISSLIIIKSKN